MTAEPRRRRIRFISQQPYEVLGHVRTFGDILDVEEAIAEDLLRHADRFEDAEHDRD